MSFPTVPFWIDGQRAVPRTTRRGAVMNPSTGEQIREVPMANAADIDAAVQSARRAFPAWRATPPLRRARILARFRVAGGQPEGDCHAHQRGTRQGAARRDGL